MITIILFKHTFLRSLKHPFTTRFQGLLNKNNRNIRYVQELYKKYFRKVLPTFLIVNIFIMSILAIEKVGNSLRTPIVILFTFATNH
jgi:hypothetical protein